MRTKLKQELPVPSGDYAFISDLTALRTRAREENAEDLVDLLEDLPKD